MTSEQRKRPPQPASTKATPGGDAVTEPQDLEADEGAALDQSAITRPVDIEADPGQRAEPDDAASTEPSELEPPERQRPPRNA